MAALSCDGVTGGNGPRLGSPITIVVGAGELWLYSTCLPALDHPSDLCGAGSTRPTGGQPPYHFELGTGGGFPPIGIGLTLNGLLGGSASVPGEYEFELCAIDLAANQGCTDVTVTVLDNATVSPSEIALNCSSPCNVAQMVTVFSTTAWTSTTPGFGGLGTGWSVNPTSGPAGNTNVTIAYSATVAQPAAGFIRFRTTVIGRYAELDVTLTSP
jgi:hypothetical protein